LDLGKDGTKQSQHLGLRKLTIDSHRCAGMPLARLILKIFLRTILERTTDFEVSGELQFARLPEIGIIGCPLTLNSVEA
jgi:hypothetical protein